MNRLSTVSCISRIFDCLKGKEMSQKLEASAFPDYAPLTKAGPEYGKINRVNPFSGYTLRNFFSEEFREGLESKLSREPSNQDQYKRALLRVAEGFINGEEEVLMKVSPLVTGINPIHPFLEPSGAIRVQVPLPSNMEQLYILTDQILGNKTANSPNNDMYKLTPKGLADPDFPAPWLQAGNEKLYLKGSAPYNRGLMIWDDPSGYAGVNTKHRFPNLTLLLLSIVFQQTDVDAYGARGRYGDATLKRLLDGHGIQCSDEIPPHRIIALISFDSDSGMPKGYITAATYETEVPSTKGGTEMAKVIFNHYAFVPKSSDVPVGPKSMKMTEAMYVYMLAYITSYVTELPLKDHLLVAHSDKSPALKAVCKSFHYYPGNKMKYKMVADGAYNAITPIASREGGLKEDAEVAEFPHIQFYDQSTVPRDDPGEEVPVPADRFYTPVYMDFCRIVKKKNPGAIIPEHLVNGKIESKHIPKLREIAKKYGYSDESPLLIWMQSTGSYEFQEVQLGASLIDEELRVAPNFPINDRANFSCINTDKLTPKPNLEGQSLAAFQKDIQLFLIQVAKDGNTGNIDYGSIPRLTDFAYMVTYQIPTGYSSPMDWGVAMAVQHMALSFAWLQNNKINFLGPIVSKAHQKILKKDIVFLGTTAAGILIMSYGLVGALKTLSSPRSNL
ncbi:hypothetical protein [Sneathiella litorea]|uniref:Uncharacterized protein n=1 Tax=Sneathiella litorea TaxID=2606216 RepID=A0A6L8W7Q2_9PROT|nr:hypothetical protein [Sneathiella litorea]MZR30410.1 hypothetical protein [Sneathiella litorea]